jgi:hypothetical protein
MTFRLSIDGPAWDRTLHEVCERAAGTVPVIKGNGYGFGAALLAQRSAELGVPAVAVGIPAEVAVVRTGFAGEVLVMEPLGRPELAGFARTGPEPGVLRTVAHTDILAGLAALGDRAPRVLLELDSPVHRHGVALAELPAMASALHRIPLAGVAIHLPMDGDRRAAIDSVRRTMSSLHAVGVRPDSLWVSHLTHPEIDGLRKAEPRLEIRSRTGTGLWLADRRTFCASGTVLDVREVPRHQPIGYRQRRAAAGTLLVVSGGTAHGVGLRAGASKGRWIDLIRAAVSGAAHGAGLTPSPFHWSGRRLHYADVPHMQVSMLLVPAGIRPPQVGDRLRCDVRMTVATFDEIVVERSTQALFHLE